MEFGTRPLAQAQGAILAHSIALGAGRLRKGVRLQADDIARLRAAGIDQVCVAVLDPDDMHEDAAAQALAEALVAPGIVADTASTGRVNLRATGPGLLAVDAERVVDVNMVNPLLTLATLDPMTRVEAGTLVATIKTISYAVPEDVVARACVAARGAMGVHPVVMRHAALVQTVVGNDDGARGHEALETRLGRLGVVLRPKQVTAHDVAPLAAALGAQTADVIFILTGSATSDLRDVAPQALRAAGGVVRRFGIPVDPGNLLFLGALGGRPVIGLPGCARSVALNGADWVLERVLCGLDIPDREFAAMGVGGVLKEIPTRPRPRDPVAAQR